LATIGRSGFRYIGASRTMARRDGALHVTCAWHL
jgi:hypothetical protein